MKKLKLSPCPENKFPDIPDMKFYRTDDEQFYFDATHCLTKVDSQAKYGVDDFLVKFDYLIETLCESNSLTKDAMTVTDGSAVFLEECLAIPFMTYIDRWFGPYIIERIEELVRYGFTISDSYCRFFHATRFEESTSGVISNQ